MPHSGLSTARRALSTLQRKTCRRMRNQDCRADTRIGATGTVCSISPCSGLVKHWGSHPTLSFRAATYDSRSTPTVTSRSGTKARENGIIRSVSDSLRKNWMIAVRWGRASLKSTGTIPRNGTATTSTLRRIMFFIANHDSPTGLSSAVSPINGRSELMTCI